MGSNPMMKWFAIWGVVSIASAVLGGVVAHAKNRDHSFWSAWSFLFPPMLLLLIALPRNQGERRRQPRLDDGAEET